MKGIENKANKIALRLNLVKIKKAKTSKMIKKTIDSKIDIFLDAKGLLKVLSTLPSKLISTKSLIIQPALRIKKDPTHKYIYQ